MMIKDIVAELRKLTESDDLPKRDFLGRAEGPEPTVRVLNLTKPLNVIILYLLFLNSISFLYRYYNIIEDR